MFIANASHRWIHRFYKILAMLLVFTAVMISAFRLLLPYVDQYRQNIESYIYQNYQINVTIHDINMSWKHWGPALVANDVSLHDNNHLQLTIDNIEVQVDFWQSLTHQTLIFSWLTLDGVVLEVATTAFLNTNENGRNLQQIADLFLNRINHLSLKNSQILMNNTVKHTVRINDLHWLNSGVRHQAQGSVIVNELKRKNVSLKIDLTGDAFDDLNGLIYLDANHLDITPWLSNYLALGNDKVKADIGFSSWLFIEKGLLEKVHVELHDNDIHWQVNGENQRVFIGAGQLLLTKNKETTGFELYSTPLLLQFNQQQAQKYEVQAHNSPTGTFAYLSFFDLALISQLSPLLISDEENRQLLTKIAVQGDASDIYYKNSAGVDRVLANFTDVSTQYSQGIPGIKHVSGQLSFTDNKLHASLSAEQGALDFKQHFIAPINYENLAAIIDLNFTKQGWQLQVDALNFNSEELALTADLLIDAPSNSETRLSLLASVTRGDASQVGRYLPLTIMSDNLVTYLNGAIIKGKIKQAQILLNGPLANFPYTDHSGVFIVDAELEQATFQFDDEWPAIQDFSANLNFTNNSMLITGRKGNLVGLNVTGVQVAIDDLLKQKILTVDTIIKESPAPIITDLMRQSPLKKSVGSVLAQLQVTGDIKGEFHLNLPLNDSEKVLASGFINFAENKVELQQPRMDFTQVDGQLSFNNDKIRTKNLTLFWQGLPLQLDIQGGNKADYYDTDIKLAVDWSVNQWQQHLPPKLTKYFAGNIQGQGGLSLHQHHNNNFSYKFTLDSDLQQTLLALPAPYNKKVGEMSPLNINVLGDLTKSTVNAQYGEQLSFSGIFDHETEHFSRAHLMLGQEEVPLPKSGFHITSQLGATDFDDWLPLISDIIETVSSDSAVNSVDKLAKSSPTLLAKPAQIRGTLTSLEIFGQRLNHVSFNLLDKPQWWLLQLDAKEASTQIKFYPDWLKQGLDIDADFIKITSGISKNKIIKGELDDSLEASKISMSDLFINEQSVFANMPQIKMHCDRCEIGKLNLGIVDFSLTRMSKDIIKIDRFTAKRTTTEFDFSGQWQQKQNSTQTHVSGSLRIDNIEQELKSLGFASLIRDSGGKVNFDLKWQGAPHEFSFNHIDGDFKTKIDDGYLAEVSDKARVFSVFSLESIVRKMTLDFRDIFSNGMFYKNITGDYHIKEGVLYTDNTFMNGAAGDMYMKGNTSFINNKLDYKITYKPNLTSSLPVLAWAATLNPVVFLAGLAIDQVITSKVVSEFAFELTGSMNEPVFKEVNRKSRDVSVGRSQPPAFVDSNSK